MDNRVTKRRVADHLEYDWYKYLLILAGAIALFVFVFIMINKTRDVEDIRIFASAYGKKEYAFSEKAMERLKAEGDERILDVELTYYNLRDTEYIMQLQTNGLMGCDVLVLGESVIKEFGSSALAIEDEMLPLLLPDGFTAEYYVDDGGVRRGIRVDELKSISNALVFDDEQVGPEGETPDYMLDSKFYLALNAKSKNLGQYTIKGDKTNAQAFSVAKTFLYCFFA